MVPGFNTDFKYRGETYHVQTEDNGIANPVVVTLLYHKGAILASRRTSYRELVEKPGFEQELMVLMKAQHKDLMRALLAGVYDKNGTAPAVSGSSGENPADAAAAVASPPAATPPTAQPQQRQQAAVTLPRVIPSGPTQRPTPPARTQPLSLDESIRHYLEQYAATAAATRR